MAGVPLKFRCYQCNQLLGVSRGKVGTVVACPKCKADLIVPDPDEADLTSDTEGANSSQSTRDSALAEEGISLDLLDIRPEDIRVEPGVTWTPQTEPSRLEQDLFPSERSETEVSDLEPTGDDPSSINLGGLIETPNPVVPKSVEPLVPPIQLESPRITDSKQAPTRSRDVVLSRSTVATWSLFVLLAQAFAFVAGLLAGHFLWRVH